MGYCYMQRLSELSAAPLPSTCDHQEAVWDLLLTRTRVPLKLRTLPSSCHILSCDYISFILFSHI